MRSLASAAILLALAASSLSAAPPKADDVPQAKRTTLGLYLTPQEAHAKWRAEPLTTVVLDVRTPAEYVFVGHAPMAYNVPFAFWRSDVFPADGKPVMQPNPNFLNRVKKIASPEETLLVMCRSGERGAKACDALAKAGYKNVYHIADGFEGDEIDNPKDPQHGKRTKNGWRNAGLPWTYKLARNLMYLPELK